ncbi:MAG TPA: DUF6443 domain-containing protein, partial [Chitinophagaceae bacterium]|nr:DUF6443 domain-containing protein [Chitinophagaceae bacterium]
MKPVYIKTAFTFLVPVIFLASAHSQITLTGNDYLSKPAGIVVDNIKVEGLFSPSNLGGIGNNDKVRTYKYVDGFGRPLQSIVEGASPNGKDLIQFSVYDEFGRSTKQYLPFEYPSVSSGTPYQDRSTALTNQASFYTTNTTANKIANDSKPYVQADVEQSP